MLLRPSLQQEKQSQRSKIEITGVLPEERNKGIATTMIVETFQWMKTKRITTALGIVNSNNKSILAVSKKSEHKSPTNN